MLHHRLYTELQTVSTDSERFPSPLNVECALVAAHVYEELGAHGRLVDLKMLSYLPYLLCIRRVIYQHRRPNSWAVERIIHVAKVTFSSLWSAGFASLVHLIQAPHHRLNRPRSGSLRLPSRSPRASLPSSGQP